MIDVQVGGLRQPVGQQRPGQNPYVFIEPDDVMAVALGGPAVHEEHCFQIFLQRVNGEPEEVGVEPADGAPPSGDIVLVGGPNEEFVDEVVFGRGDAHPIPTC